MRHGCTRSYAAREISKSFKRWKRRSAGSKDNATEVLLLLFFFRTLKGFLQIPSGFFQSPECIVVGLQRLAVLVDRALPLPGDVKNFPQLYAAPDFRPSRIAIAVDRFPVGICR